MRQSLGYSGRCLCGFWRITGYGPRRSSEPVLSLVTLPGLTATLSQRYTSLLSVFRKERRGCRNRLCDSRERGNREQGQR